MKIVFVAPTYLPSRRANTLQVMKMAQATRDLGHSIRLLVPDGGQGKAPDWDSLAHHYGLRGRIDVEWLPVNSGFRRYDYGLKAVLYARRWGADLLYTRLPQAAAFASSLKIATVFEVHDLPGGFWGPILFRKYLRGQGACRLVLITKSLKDAISSEVIPLPDAPFTLIEPDGVDLVRYENIPVPEDARRRLHNGRLPQLPISTFTVGYTGHLYPGRGVGLILDMAAELPDVTFLLVGGDPQTVKEFQAEVNERILKNVILTGFIPNSDLPLFQAACDVLLMPYQQSVAASSGGDISHFLSPMKLFEYLACGRVILSSHLPVLQEVLNDQTAILLPPDDLSAWITALLNIIDNPYRQMEMGAQARDASKRYSWAARAARIFALEDIKLR